MKFIFCILALMVQPLFSYYTYRKQDKNIAALKVPMAALSGFYLIVQFWVFIKVCLKMPGKYQIYAYLLQGVILAIFIIAELTLLAHNSHIQRIDNQEKESIQDFKNLIRELQVCKIQIKEFDRQQMLDKLVERMKYEDPVSSYVVAQENNKIHELILKLSDVIEEEEFKKICREIDNQLDIRKVKNVKM